MHRLIHPWRSRLAPALLAVGLVLGGAAAGGCATDGPSMSGFALGDLRIVSKGDIVELRYPIRPDGSRQWRVSSYDSFHLQLIDNPSIRQRPDGRFEMVMRARAREEGDTTVVLTSRPPAGGEVRQVEFKVRIVP